ncbi:MAG: DUF2306 domain-containing protein [Flavobacteriales bacterium]|nr:DUF2306 domain-containing protein [Flavobacteriales bacterium]
MSGGLLGTKAEVLLSSPVWKLALYGHILIGSIALMIGWLQFSTRLRLKHVKLHRGLGKTYIMAVLFSGISALYLSFFATGGWIASLGFGSLAVFWVYSTINALLSIRKGRLECHRNWMFRSYALTFAAVTLRIWLPLLTGAFSMEFVQAYVIIAWLCWVPNWIFAEIYIRKYPPQFQLKRT